MMDKSYKEAGVDLNLSDQIIEKAKPLIQKTFIPGVIGEIGGFGGFFSLAPQKYQEPVLVSGTDGVGTKLKIAFALNKHDSVGIDLVAMCVNDVITSGAKPLFFLDYISIGKLSEKIGLATLEGVVAGCKMANCALIGGETAQMPGFYKEGEYDLAGFAVGIVERSKIIEGKEIKAGDLVIGLTSNGLHSNSFSLVRKVLLESNKYKLEDKIPALNRTLGEELLIPTKIYVQPILSLLEKYKILGIAHITGGGIIENIPRVLPAGVSIQLDQKDWSKPYIFSLIQKEGNISNEEMYRTFNMGMGMVLIVHRNEVSEILRELKLMGCDSCIIGKVIEGNKEVII